MIHLPIKFKRGEIIYNLIKIYDGGFGLYENNKTRTRECFTPFQLGVLDEMVKPERQANKGGVIKFK